MYSWVFSISLNFKRSAGGRFSLWCFDVSKCVKSWTFVHWSLFNCFKTRIWATLKHYLTSRARNVSIKRNREESADDESFKNQRYENLSSWGQSWKVFFFSWYGRLFFLLCLLLFWFKFFYKVYWQLVNNQLILSSNVLI